MEIVTAIALEDITLNRDYDEDQPFLSCLVVEAGSEVSILLDLDGGRMYAFYSGYNCRYSAEVTMAQIEPV